MTKVAILWHMHQPYYEDLATGEHVLPWVRLHALKDYYGMVALLDEFPRVKLTFNLVPSLLLQLEAFAAGRAWDRHLELGLKPAAELTAEERGFIIDNFFHAQPARMIGPFPRYRDLFEKRRGSGNPRRDEEDAFSVADVRDLQVWQKLAWVDASYLASDPRCRALIERGEGFTEEDKALLRGVELEILNRVIPAYREAAGRGQVELSTSPFYHPILPLLCDTDVYLRTHPHTRMPRQRFRRPDDAREQLVRAMAYHERLFGQPPRGVWPSEGSVSDETVALVSATGFQWMATDELILARTLETTWTRDGAGHLDRPELLYRPYRVEVGNAQVACMFRDHNLSDLIGFRYSGWDADAAATDFVQRLREAGRRFALRTNGGEAIVPIILDGENAWEHYAESGRPFLRALYRLLSDDPELETVTMSEACARVESTVPGLFPGSWIDGNFSVWIGHSDDHRAWGQLAEARGLLDTVSVGEASRQQATEELLIAEGSDWFWWYGDDDSSEHDLIFDDLFRRHLRNVYRALDQPVPDELFVTNITTAAHAPSWSAPSALIAPTIEGLDTSYFEWLGAGVLEPVSTAGTMHQATEGARPMLRAVHYGFDLTTLYLRIDFWQAARDVLDGGRTVVVKCLRPAGHSLLIEGAGKSSSARLAVNSGGPLAAPGLSVAVEDIVELALPLSLLGLQHGETLAFFVVLSDEGRGHLEQHPAFRPVELEVPGEEFDSLHWTP